MARRGEQFAKLGSHGGYTQAPAVGKGFSGSERSAAREQAGRTRWNGSAGGELRNAFARHQELIRNYLRYHPSASVPSGGAVDGTIPAGKKSLSDDDALRRQHRFVRDPTEDRLAEESTALLDVQISSMNEMFGVSRFASEERSSHFFTARARGREGEAVDPSAWEVRMAAKYYKLLFKEYALTDLSRFREDKVGFRWRTEKDVVSGKGQFECGELRCQERSDLHSYETNFKYKEAGTVKNELVKVRVCPQCAQKLFHKKIKALRRHQQQQEQEEEEEANRMKKGRRSKHGINSGKGKGADEVERSDRRGTSEADLGAKEVATRCESSLNEGHELVLRAVAAAAAGGGTGPSTTIDQSRSKRLRPSRWKDSVDAPAEAGKQESTGGVTSQAGSAVGDASAESASRRAWAGEIEKDRTAEDDMDDYLSSLFL